MKQPDPRQFTLDLPDPRAGIEPIAVALGPELTPSPPTHDLQTLYELIEERDGVPGILASRFAEWSGYVRPKSFREYLERIRPELEEFGSLALLNPMIRIGKGGRRQVRDYWLNRSQLNHALIYTRLLRLRALRLFVTKVFTAYQNRTLVSTTAETTIALQDAAVAAEEATPGITRIGSELAWREDVRQAAQWSERAAHNSEQARDAAWETLKAILEFKSGTRRDPTIEAKSCSKFIVWENYRGVCPCCQTTVIMERPGRLKDKAAHWDHTGQRHKRGPMDGWYMCVECNLKFQRDETYRADTQAAWANYLRLVKEYFKLSQPSFAVSPSHKA